MEKDIYLIYDGTFNGFLTAVYVAFESKTEIAGVQSKSVQQNALFTENKIIITNIELAKRVWYGVSKRNNVVMKTIYFAFLSESEDIPFLLFKYIQKIVAKNNSTSPDLPEGTIHKIYYLAELVSKRKNQIESSMQLKISEDGVLFGVLSPDYNMLPLISKYFRSAYNDKHWLLYDSQRNYGLYYNLNTVQLISFDKKELRNSPCSSSWMIPEKRNKFDDIWNSFFTKSIIQKLVSDRNRTHNLLVKKQVYRENREAV